MKRPCPDDLADAARWLEEASKGGCEDGPALSRVATWLASEATLSSARSIARRVGCSVAYAKANLMGTPQR